MNRNYVLAILSGVIAFCPAGIFGKDVQSIKLLKPQTNIGKPLMQVLKNRETMREFSPKDLSLQDLSNLLWAGFGINREGSGKRTAPSAMNMQEIDIYVASASGLYLYDAKLNELKIISPGDARAMTGNQPFVKEAPINLIFVADFSKMGGDSENKKFYSAVDTGYISQNVYLYCASFGLATVVRGYVDKDNLSKTMNLRSDQKIILAQTVGYPKK